mgnify:CR=1 FL=1
MNNFLAELPIMLQQMANNHYVNNSGRFSQEEIDEANKRYEMLFDRYHTQPKYKQDTI